jgi:uncharacterized protein YecT (DUF1311 family)
MNEPAAPCSDVSVMTDLVVCLSKAKDAAQSKLNVAYRGIMKKLSVEDANRLAATQKIWLKYREEKCSAERALYDGGIGAYPAYLACVESMTRQRTKELKITYRVRKVPSP